VNLHPIARALFWPASVLFGGAARLRAWFYLRGIFRQRRLRGVVISAGNLTVGGTGKTPMVIWLAERLQAEGKRAGILLRGYGGPAIAGRRARPETSDEVCLLRERLRIPLGIGRDRYREGLSLAREGVEWFLLDDGFQHLQLARDADILLVDATDPFGGGHLLPAGRLREPRSAAARADLVVITRSDHAPAVETILRRYASAPVFYAQTRLEGVYEVRQAPSGAGPPAYAPQGAAAAGRPTQAGREDWAQRRLFAFCGVGNPAAFFEDLRRWGFDIAGKAAYPDHHLYDERDAEELERRARAVGASALLCTEKDVPNLARARIGGPHMLPVGYCRIALEILDGEGFWKALHAAVERKQASVGP